MKNTMRAQLGLAILTSMLFAGCASVAVTGDAIEKNTAHALGLQPGSFTISEREDSGIKTTYKVATNSGKKYSCYVTGTVSVVGRTVSDAMCNEMSSVPGKPGKVAMTPAPVANCNALLKAAGRCK